MNTPLELAEGLQHSNIAEVATIAKALLALNTSYDELKMAYVRLTGEVIMQKHEKLFKRLAEYEETEK